MVVTSEQGATENSNAEYIIRNPFRKFSLIDYMKEELIQSMRTKQEMSGTDNRGPFNNRVYTFVTVPQYFESFMAYGLLQSLDHLLVVYTLLPLRCFLAVIRLVIQLLQSAPSVFSKQTRPSSSCFVDDFSVRYLHRHEVRDLIRFSLLFICTWILLKVDSSVVYHEIRTQSVIKIYIFFNLLEVADRLLSAICQDALDDLLHTGSKLTVCCRNTHSDPVSGSYSAVLVRDFLFQYCFALVCCFAHCFLLLCQVTTLNVAFNSQNKSLVTVFISNNFVELKGNVFRKMEKTNLFQITCADVRERFHYAVWLSIVVCRNMSDTGWNLDDLWPMLKDVFSIFLAEISVDWIKHSFITKFNVIPSDVYKEYSVSLAYDLLLCRQGQNTADYFDLVSRRMGLTPIPLSCLINVMLLQTVRNPNVLWCSLPIVLPALLLLKTLANLALLSIAYKRVKAYIKAMSVVQRETKQSEECSTPTRKENVEHARSDDLVNDPFSPDLELRATGSFPLQYMGYDQPAKEDHFLPMLLRHRRVHSDSSCFPNPSISEEGQQIDVNGDAVVKLGSVLNSVPITDIRYNRMLSDSGSYNQEHRQSPLLVRPATPIRMLSPYLDSQTPRTNLSRMTSENLELANSENGLFDEHPIIASSFIHNLDDNEMQARNPSEEGDVRVGSPYLSSDPIMLNRCYSIDLGVLSGFRAVPAVDTMQTAANDAEPAQFIRRRRKRTRTEGSVMETPEHVMEKRLPVMWERSSRNSVAQPFGVKFLVKQPLSDVVRYSMVEGQIS